MKTSNKILFFASLIFLILIIVIIINFRLFVNKKMALGNSNNDQTLYKTSKFTKRTFDYSNYDKLEINGFWDIEILPGNSWNLEIRGHSFENIKIRVQNSKLTIDKKHDNFLSDERFFIRILMPVLKQLSTSGSGKVSIGNYTCNELVLNISGAIKVFGNEIIAENLKINCRGASKINFETCLIKNAHIISSGASSIDLYMTGGDLSGTVSGAGRVFYSGHIASQHIFSSGAVNIKKVEKF